VTHAINLIITILLTIAEWVLGAIGVFDAFLAALMTSAGLPPNLQILVLVVVAIMLVVFAIRLLGPILSFLLIILLILLIAHRLVPGMQMPHSLLPGNWQNGSVHI
jgi:hypothetical protein